MPLTEDNRNAPRYNDYYAQHPEMDPRFNRAPGDRRPIPVDTRQYGQTPGGAVAEATRASDLGAARGERAFSLGDKLGAAAQSQQAGALNSQGRYEDISARMYGQGAAANATQNATRGSQMAALDRLRSFYEAPQGPSAAEAQLRQGQNSAESQALTLARSGGGSPSSIRAAMRSNAATNVAANNAAATLRAQENDAYQGRRLAAMGAEQSGLAGVRGADIGAMGTTYGAAGNVAQTGLGYGGLAQGYGQQRVAAELGGAGMGMSAQQFGESQRAGILGQQLGADTSRYGADRGVSVGMAQIAQQEKAADMAMYGSLIAGGMNMMVPGAGTAASKVASDVRAKENIRPASDIAASLDALDAGYARETADVGPRVDLRPAQGFSYDYKDPARHGAGTHVGPMAQDLEQSAAAGAVGMAPDGTKTVDPGRLTMVNTSAISEQQRRIDRLEQLASGAGPGGGSGERVAARMQEITAPERQRLASFQDTSDATRDQWDREAIEASRRAPYRRRIRGERY